MDLTSVVAYAALFTFGMIVAFPGSIKLRFVKRLGIDDARMGRLVMAWQAVALAATLLAGPLLDHIGHRYILVAGFLISGVAIGVFAVAQRISVAFLAAALLGIGGSCVNVGGNTLLPALNPTNQAAASSLGTAFFGIGAFLVPFVMAFLFERLSFGCSLGVFALLAAAPATLAAVTWYPAVASTFQVSALRALLVNHAVLLAACMLFCSSSLEVSVATWTTTYLRNAGFKEKGASIIFALFYITLIVGRLTTSQLVRNQIARPTVQIMALAVCAVLLIMTFRIGAGGGAACVIVLGLCFAPLFPTTIGATFAKFPRALYGTVFSIAFGLGRLGPITVPAAIGSISQRSSIRDGYRLMAGLALLLSVLAFWL